MSTFLQFIQSFLDIKDFESFCSRATTTYYNLMQPTENRITISEIVQIFTKLKLSNINMWFSQNILKDWSIEKLILLMIIY